LRMSFLLSALGAVVYGQSGSISGTIVDEHGASVSGAEVVIQKLTTFTRSPDGHAVIAQPGFSTTVSADSGGRFSVTGVGAGRYHICGYGTAPSQVASCDWAGVPVVTLEAGQVLTGITRNVVSGVLITLNVADPHGRLTNIERFHIGLGDKTFYQRAKQVSKTSTSRVFQIAVPPQRTLGLFIDSEVDLSILNSVGASLQTGRLTAENIATGSGGQFTISLTLP